MSKQIIERLRANYPTPLGARHGAFLLEAAAAVRMGLVRKSWGTFVTLPDGTGVSQDCVMEPSGVHYDILEDGENRAAPSWQLVTLPGTEAPLILPADRFYAVPVAPPPPPPPPPPDLSAVIEVLLSLAARIEAMGTELKALRADLNAASARPWPEYTTRVFGQTLTLTPKK